MTRSTALFSLLFAGFLSSAAPGSAETATPILKVGSHGKPISPDLFGIFFEDLNWAADGGLYAELIQNRSFEYQATEQVTWNPLTAWQVVTRGGARASLSVEAADPIHPNNPHYAVLEVRELGDGAGVMNDGFDGLPIVKGERYDVSLFAKQLYIGDRWSHAPTAATPSPLTVRLESANGENLGEATLGAPDWKWTHLTATLTARASDEAARFILFTAGRGGVAFDVVSLFPEKTFHGRRNGLRADLAQTIAELHPRFVRFPGGCLAHGNGLGNIYRWKDTIGPIEQRREQANLWGYHQSVGLGYFEFFQFCEDISATPLPVIAAAVCCQNSDHKGGTGQRGLPLEQMPAYIQDILDLIEYANGPTTSHWGAQRAAAGHAEPFHLKYLGIGNEDAQTPEFRERFKLIFDAVKRAHPEITVVGTVGPFPDGEDFDAGWKTARELAVPIVDEHYYKSPEWFLANRARYDAYDRAGPHVYVGEYAAHDTGRRSTLRSALAEAAYMTSLERSGDVVRMASYAPLLARAGHTQWTPDLIYFTATAVFPTVNYHVQQLFGANAGDIYLPATPSRDVPAEVAFSVVQDSRSGDVIVKLVNTGDAAHALRVELPHELHAAATGTKTVLTGDPLAVNAVGEAPGIVPKSAPCEGGDIFAVDAPAHSLTVVRLKTR